MPEATVARGEGGRLDAWLARLPEVGSRAAAERLIGSGSVRVDGVPRAKSFRVEPGARVEFAARASAPLEPEPADAEALGVAIRHVDDDLLVVDKPAGLLVHAVPGVHGPTLVAALAGRAGGGEDAARPGIVHRLDRDTSGLLVVARHDEALRRLQALLRRRRIERTYLALVRGRPASRRGTIDAPIGRDRGDPTRISLDTDVPREAVTHFEIARALGPWSLLRVTLETGRTHQIRVHLAAIGHPVAGDPVYGHAGELRLERQFLHAAELRFPHPMDGTPVEVVSGLPADLAAALAAAERNA
jgi:23S rRNA pseudouridine1911/1915/1917 synthase